MFHCFCFTSQILFLKKCLCTNFWNLAYINWFSSFLDMFSLVKNFSSSNLVFLFGYFMSIYQSNRMYEYFLKILRVWTFSNQILNFLLEVISRRCIGFVCMHLKGKQPYFRFLKAQFILKTNLLYIWFIGNIIKRV